HGIDVSVDDLIDLVSVLEANRDGSLGEAAIPPDDWVDERFTGFVVGAIVGHNAPDPECKGEVAKIVSLFATPTGPFARLDQLLAGDRGHRLEDLHVLAPPVPAGSPVMRGDNLFEVGAIVAHNTPCGSASVTAKITGLRFDVGMGGSIAFLDRELVGNREHLLRDLHVVAPAGPPVEDFVVGARVRYKETGHEATIVELWQGSVVLDRSFLAKVYPSSCKPTVATRIFRPDELEQVRP
ncbi:hypothetical protein LCGC14_2314320, partial [marine sediment metagenome]